MEKDQSYFALLQRLEVEPIVYDYKKVYFSSTYERALNNESLSVSSSSLVVVLQMLDEPCRGCWDAGCEASLREQH